MSRRRVRYLSPDRLRRHEQGVKRLDEAFGYSGPGPVRQLDEDWKRNLLGLLGFNKKATDKP